VNEKESTSGHTSIIPLERVSLTHTWADEEQSGVTLLVGFSESSERDTLGLVALDAFVHAAGLFGSGEAAEKEDAGAEEEKTQQKRSAIGIDSKLTLAPMH
jgi:hypothetical protein